MKMIHTMTGTPNGDIIDLGDWYSQVTITAGGACNCYAVAQAPGSSAPSAPVATPVPAAGAETAGYNDMVTGDVDTFKMDPSGLTKYRYVLVWEKAAAVLNIEAL